jgi:hypothetical protein
MAEKQFELSPKVKAELAKREAELKKRIQETKVVAKNIDVADAKMQMVEKELK